MDAPVETATAVGFAAFPDSGYYVLAHRGGRLIADYGSPGKSPNPGHQHAGIFSYELSLGNRRVIVDSGTPTYGEGEERQRARGTAAHNTVRVDGTNQYELWKTFRVGRRAKVGAVRHQTDSDYAWISAAHDGYNRLGFEHRRAIALLGGCGWVVVDWFHGSGRHRIESFLHLHPEIEVLASASEAALPQAGYSVIELTKGPFEMRDDWYSSRLGRRVPSRTLVRSEEVTLEAGEGPVVWAYALLKSPASGASIGHPHQPVIEIATPGTTWTITTETNDLLRITRNRE